MRDEILKIIICQNALADSIEAQDDFPKGNKSAHGGDAALDCQLYKGIRPRNDLDDFERLYGFPWQIVDRLSK